MSAPELAMKAAFDITPQFAREEISPRIDNALGAAFPKTAGALQGITGAASGFLTPGSIGMIKGLGALGSAAARGVRGAKTARTLTELGIGTSVAIGAGKTVNAGVDAWIKGDEQEAVKLFTNAGVDAAMTALIIGGWRAKYKNAKARVDARNLMIEEMRAATTKDVTPPGWKPPTTRAGQQPLPVAPELPSPTPPASSQALVSQQGQYPAQRRLALQPAQQATPASGQAKPYSWDVIEYDTLKQQIDINRRNVPEERIKEYRDGINIGLAKHRLFKLIGPKNETILKNNQEEVRLNKTSVGKLLSDTAVRKSVKNGFTVKQHNAAAASIDSLFENSTKMLSRNDDGGNPNVTIHRYASPLHGDNAAFITVKETLERGKRAHSVELILARELEGRLGETGFNPAIHPSASSSRAGTPEGILDETRLNPATLPTPRAQTGTTIPQPTPPSQAASERRTQAADIKNRMAEETQYFDPSVRSMVDDSVDIRMQEIESDFSQGLGNLSGKAKNIDTRDWNYDATKNLTNADKNFGKIKVKSLAPELADMPESPSRIAKAIRKDKDNLLYLRVKERVQQDTLERHADDIEMANERAAIQAEGKGMETIQEAIQTVERATPERKADSISDARQKAAAFIGLPLTNQETGIVGTVSNLNLRKMTSKSAMEKSASPESHIIAVANADKLFRNATYDHAHGDKKGEPTIKAIHRFVAPMVMPNGEVLITKITLKETTGTKEPNPIYTIETIDVEKPTLLAPSNEGIERGIGVNDVATSATGGLISNVSDIVEKVKRALEVEAAREPRATTRTSQSLKPTSETRPAPDKKSIGDSGSKVNTANQTLEDILFGDD